MSSLSILKKMTLFWGLLHACQTFSLFYLMRSYLSDFWPRVLLVFQSQNAELQFFQYSESVWKVGKIDSKKNHNDWFQTRADERDREDAISFASRRSLAKVPQPGGTVPRHAINTNASMRSSKRSIHSNTSKKYPPEGSYMGGHHTTYSLWSAQNSLKREHKRKFNRSLCGVLLAFSIVLVILGILGIIGIAVYLGGKWQSECHISLGWWLDNLLWVFTL